MTDYGGRSSGQVSGLIPDFLRSGPDGSVFYGWRLVLILALLTLLVEERVGASAWAYHLIFMAGSDTDWLQELWQRLSWATGLANVFPLVLLPVAGGLVDQYGPRRLALIGLPIVGVGFMSLLAITQLDIIVYVGIFLMSVGVALGYTLVAPTALNNWFRRRKTVAMAMPLFALRLWQAAFRPLLAVLTGALGWTGTVALAGIVVLAAVGPLAWMIRNRPEDYGEHPDGALATNAELVLPDYNWRGALVSRQFWMLTVAGACLNAAGMASIIASSQVAAVLPLSVANQELLDTVETVLFAAAILAGGILGDRFPIRFVLIGSALLQAASIAALTTGTLPGALLYHILGGIGRGGRVAPALAVFGSYFGRSNFATILAISYLLSSLLNATVGFGVVAGVGTLLDVSYSAAIPLLLAIAVAVIGVGLYWRLGPPRLSPSQRAESPAVS